MIETFRKIWTRRLHSKYESDQNLVPLVAKHIWVLDLMAILVQVMAALFCLPNSKPACVCCWENAPNIYGDGSGFGVVWFGFVSVDFTHTTLCYGYIRPWYLGLSYIA